jgi:hypothetical protein
VNHIRAAGGLRGQGYDAVTLPMGQPAPLGVPVPQPSAVALQQTLHRIDRANQLLREVMSKAHEGTPSQGQGAAPPIHRTSPPLHATMPTPTLQEPRVQPGAATQDMPVTNAVPIDDDLARWGEYRLASGEGEVGGGVEAVDPEGIVDANALGSIDGLADLDELDVSDVLNQLSALDERLSVSLGHLSVSGTPGQGEGSFKKELRRELLAVRAAHTPTQPSVLAADAIAATEVSAAGSPARGLSSWASGGSSGSGGMGQVRGVSREELERELRAVRAVAGGKRGLAPPPPVPKADLRPGGHNKPSREARGRGGVTPGTLDPPDNEQRLPELPDFWEDGGVSTEDRSRSWLLPPGTSLASLLDEERLRM